MVAYRHCGFPSHKKLRTPSLSSRLVQRASAFGIQGTGGSRAARSPMLTPRTRTRQRRSLTWRRKRVCERCCRRWFDSIGTANEDAGVLHLLILACSMRSSIDLSLPWPDLRRAVRAVDCMSWYVVNRQGVFEDSGACGEKRWGEQGLILILLTMTSSMP